MLHRAGQVVKKEKKKIPNGKNGVDETPSSCTSLTLAEEEINVRRANVLNSFSVQLTQL